MSDDQLTATLDEIRGRGYRNGARGALCARLSDAAAVDAPRLLAALDAVLKLPTDWERETARLDALAQSTADPHSRGAISMRAQAFEECARVLREALTAELTKGARNAPH